MAVDASGHNLAINEVSSYLYSYDRPLYDRLMVEPDIPENVLTLGEELGDEETRVNRQVLLAQCKVLAASLESAQIKARVRMDKLQAKVEKLRQLRFRSAIAAAVAAAVTSLSAILNSTTTTIILSIATFASTIANAAGAAYVLGQNGTEEEVLALIQELDETQTFAAVSSRYLKAVASGDYPVEESAALVTEANKYFGKLVTALKNSAKYVVGAAAESEGQVHVTVVSGAAAGADNPGTRTAS
jgi:hypothetical protein